MKNITTKCLLDCEKIAEKHNIEITSFEQDYEFKIGKEGYTYESSLERDAEGNIEDIINYGALAVDYTAETKIARALNDDSAEWYYLDKKLFDADKGETIVHDVNASFFIRKNDFNEEELDFIEENTGSDGYMKLYVTVTNNTIVEEEI